MRTLAAGLLPLLLLLACGCAGTRDTTVGPPPGTDPTTSSPTTAPRSAPNTSPSTDAATCAEVRAGIAAFNTGDYPGTVSHFVRAVPLAEAQVRDHDSPAADDLLAAVRYYARLAPERYLDASASSPEFAKYKAITLGQCEAGAPDGATPSDGGVTI